MAINHEYKVLSMDILNNDDKIVCEVRVQIISTDDSDPENLHTTSKIACVLKTDISADSEEFTPFDQLGEETVLGWVMNQIIESGQLENQERIIEFMKNPPQPSIISTPLPW